MPNESAADVWNCIRRMHRDRLVSGPVCTLWELRAAARGLDGVEARHRGMCVHRWGDRGDAIRRHRRADDG